MQDGEIAAKECCLFLYDVLLEQRRDFIAKQSLVILPDLPFDFHCTDFIQLLISHHLLQLLLWDLHKNITTEIRKETYVRNSSKQNTNGSSLTFGKCFITCMTTG